MALTLKYCLEFCVELMLIGDENAVAKISFFNVFHQPIVRFDIDGISGFDRFDRIYRPSWFCADIWFWWSIFFAIHLQMAGKANVQNAANNSQRYRD